MLDRAGAAPAFEEELVGAAPEVDREEGLRSGPFPSLCGIRVCGVCVWCLWGVVMFASLKVRPFVYC